MRSVRFADVYSLPNLLRNGGFDCLSVDAAGARYAPWWTVVGAAYQAVGANAYDFVQETPSEDDGASDYLRLMISEDRPVLLRQSFTADAAWAVLDFPVPLTPGGPRTAVAEGYRSRHDRLLPRTRTYTAGAAVRIVRGRAALTVRFLDAAGTAISGGELDAFLDARTSKRIWRRRSGTLPAVATPAAVEFYLQRLPGGDFAEVHLGEIQLITGAQASAPYTGDAEVSAVPPGVVVLAMGDSCPPGYLELEEPEAGTPPAEWTSVDVEAGLRYKAFPIGAASGDGEPQGAPTHNRESYQFSLAVDDIEAFESFEGKFGEKPDLTADTGYNPAVPVVGDEPNSEGKADHQHNVGDGGSVPGHRPFRFCRKI